MTSSGRPGAGAHATSRPLPGAQVRVATLNLASGRPADLRGDRGGPPEAALGEDALAAALAPLGPDGLGVDVLALQEVDLAQPRSSGVDQTAVAARALGADPATGAAFAPALLGTPSVVRDWTPAPPTVVLGRPFGSPGADPGAAAQAHPAQYGVALVSRLPVLGWRVLRLPGGTAKLPLPVQDPATGRSGVLLFPDEPRVALAATLDAGPLGTVTVACTHLSFWPTTAVRQLRMVWRWLADVPGPVVLAGDLNLPGTVPARLLGAQALTRHLTYPASGPRRQLDHLLMRRDGAAGALGHHPAGSVRLAVSDHRGLVAVLTG